MFCRISNKGKSMGLFRNKKKQKKQKVWRQPRRHNGRVSAVILAGGSSSRMGGQDKMAAQLAGVSVIRRSILAFQQCSMVDEIVLVTREEGKNAVFFACDGCDKVTRVVQGGDSRARSAYQGVMAAAADAEIILIHDGARPLVSDTVIRAVVEAARKYGAALPVVPVVDTVKVGDNGFVAETPDRSSLFAAQTPQGFYGGLIKAALSDALQQNAEITDDASAVERLGMHVRMVDGDVENRKITTPDDLLAAEALLRKRAEA